MGKYELASAVIILVFLGSLALVATTEKQRPGTDQSSLKKFSSEAELKAFLQANQGGGYGAGDLRIGAPMAGGMAAGGIAPPMAPGGDMGAAREASTGAGAASEDYSTTNIQVSGVDEADYVKNDGKYVYTIAGENVVIIEAFPAETARTVATINLSGKQPVALYINGDRLVVFGNVYTYDYRRGPMLAGGDMEETATDEGGDLSSTTTVRAGTTLSLNGAVIRPPSEQKTYARVYDITDRANPTLVKEVELDGSYSDSRMIGDYVYDVINSPAYYYGYETGSFAVPRFSPDQQGFPDVYYFDYPDSSYQFTNIVSINVRNPDQVSNKAFLLGYSASLFVSQENIYLTYQKRVPQDLFFNRILDEVILPVVPISVAVEVRAARGGNKSSFEIQQDVSTILQEWGAGLTPEETAALQASLQEKYDRIAEEVARESDKSVVHKIHVQNGAIEYATRGEVFGAPLNQFSMDEHDGTFRIATTSNRWDWHNQPSNNVYVLDSSMRVIGKLEGLAPGESIFSARFLGDRAYLVTFVRVDPLFVIDLSDPANPRVLGELKIPGVSDYLHPYDDTHIIGVGRATDDEAGRVTFKGLKIALFDVSDVANPRELSKLEIGDSGTSSDALNDHHAFLFSREKNLLVLPVSVYNVRPMEATTNYDHSWQGALVLNIDLANGIVERGRVTHDTGAEDQGWWGKYAPISRSLFIGDNLYTLSSSFLQANSLSDPTNQLAKVELPAPAYYSGPYYIE